MFHCVPVLSIQWYLRSMRWLQCGNKGHPLFPVPWMLAILSVLALWGRKQPWDETSQYTKTHQLIARTSLLAINDDFPLALLHLVGGYLWMTSFILLFKHRWSEWALWGQHAVDQIIYFPERRKPCCLWRIILRRRHCVLLECSRKPCDLFILSFVSTNWKPKSWSHI